MKTIVVLLISIFALSGVSCSESDHPQREYYAGKCFKQNEAFADTCRMGCPPGYEQTSSCTCRSTHSSYEASNNNNNNNVSWPSWVYDLVDILQSIGVLCLALLVFGLIIVFVDMCPEETKTLLDIYLYLSIIEALRGPRR